MRTFLTLIFILIPCAVSAKENLDESLVKEITEGIGTLSFKLNDEVTMNKVNVDGEEVSLIKYFGEFDYFTDNFIIEGSKGRREGEYDNQKILLKHKSSKDNKKVVNFIELEYRNDSIIHYKEIRCNAKANSQFVPIMKEKLTYEIL